MPRSPEPAPTTTVWVNARFLDRPVTGVERVGRELLHALATELLDREGCWTEGGRRYRLRLVAPAGGDVVSPWPNLPILRRGVLAGHAWEQVELPWLTRGEWLVSLCNTGPLLKRRHVLFLHDAQPFAIPENFSRAFGLWYRFLFRAAGRSAARLLVNSRFTRSELVARVGLDARKMHVCTPGSEHVNRMEGAPGVLDDLGLPDAPFLLAVASANPNKNFRAVVLALEALGAEAPPCVIVGRTDQRHFGDARLEPGRITHLGYVSDEQLLALYRRALALVFPSFYEGFGLPPLEAMALGCPVIAARTSAMPEVCGAAVEYCSPEHPHTLAEAIVRVAEDTERRREMQRSGLDRAAWFSWRASARGLLTQLERCCRGCPDAAGRAVDTGAASASGDCGTCRRD